MYGKDFNYANSRICKTVVRLMKNNEPVYITYVSRDGLCTAEYLEKINLGQEFFVHLDELNLEPVKLGYVNSQGLVTYLQRVPIRRGPNNQGLRRENCISSGQNIFTLPNKALRQCIIGDYPSFANVLAALDKDKTNRKSLAFHRHWAVYRGKALLYKNNLPVGSIVDGVAVLEDRFKHLKEYLGECL